MESKDPKSSHESKMKNDLSAEKKDELTKDLPNDMVPEEFEAEGVKSNEELNTELSQAMDIGKVTTPEKEYDRIESRLETTNEVSSTETGLVEAIEPPEEGDDDTPPKVEVDEKVDQAMQDVMEETVSKPLTVESNEKENIIIREDEDIKPDEKADHEVIDMTPENVEKDLKTKPDIPKTSVEKEKKDNQATKEKKRVDYNTFTEIDLVNELRNIVHNNQDGNIKTEVEAIQAAFYKKLKDSVNQQRKEYIEENGSDEEFKPEENSYENDVKELLKEYRSQRVEYNKRQEEIKEENLKQKYEVIEGIKSLINKEESINKTFQEFRDLQKRWREIGLVPQSALKNLWENYHFNVENFYDYIKINQELRDLDLRKNLESKIHLCELAEELLVEPNVIKAFKTLQKYHDQWREIGPVPREKREDLWERFKTVTSTINKKHQEYFENIKLEQKKNLEAKKALCEQIETILDREIVTNKDWDALSKEVINLQKVWRTIGYAPRKDNTEIYERFRSSCDKFFDRKREYFAESKEMQKNNLQAKLDLCEQAEAMQESDDWRKTTNDYIEIQKKWKEVGPVNRKQSDIIWKRFRKACDHFFKRKSEHFSNINEQYDDNLKLKNDLIKEIEDFKFEEDVNSNLEKLQEFQRRWTDIGYVPFKHKDDVQRRFRKAINMHYDKLNVGESKRNMLKFKNKMSTFSETTRGQSKIRMERDKFAFKLKNLENDLVLLENNIGFFANSKNAESLIEDVNKKIEQTKESIKQLKKKIRLIDEMEDQED